LGQGKRESSGRPADLGRHLLRSCGVAAGDDHIVTPLDETFGDEPPEPAAAADHQ